ncbi:hypothetical protein MKW92_006575 [Papaver armeniacum]|nr:hypothetical protein MKW92_006575 [Papaver armeniacum]
MTAIEEMAGMDVLCSDKIGTLTLNRLNLEKYMPSLTRLLKGDCGLLGLLVR